MCCGLITTSIVNYFLINECCVIYYPLLKSYDSADILQTVI